MTLRTDASSLFPEAEQQQHLFRSSARYQARFFGLFRVTLDQQPLGEPGWRRNKARTLLKWFLLNPGDLFEIGQLARLLWPQATASSAVSNLHVTIHYLRHMLEPELATGRPSTFIRRNRHNYYWFELNDAWWTDALDAHSLRSRFKEAAQVGEISQATALANQLLAYYELKFLPEDVYEDLFASFRRQHEYAHLQLLEQLIESCAVAEHYDDALSYALRMRVLDPYSEIAVRTIAHIHLLQGNTTAAIRQIDTFQRFLKQDMGVDPGEELLSMRHDILKVL
ncbi:MAG TPA: BTAD domain-containing putative transcriptional regulator [Ktedonobacteraceae bacterium]